ncbi:hypothetical protein F4811DRAFT_503336 [Daldinia bambusicola]|nr:hypothetical protein F4811DRAFT_503336 [Daldinia bambusicola]
MALFRSFHSSDPPPPPTAERRKKLLGLVDIYHPGYPNSSPLLSLSASDDGGIHYTVVYYACCIVAGNVWKEKEGRDKNQNEPFLSENRSPKPIDIPGDDILRNKRYYFHVPDPAYPNYRYPIVTSFTYWIFPKSLPAPWESLKPPLTSPANRTEAVTPSSAPPRGSPPPAVSCHTEACRVTGHLNGLDLAHIIPEASEAWFRANFMREYSTSSSMHNDPLNDSPNLIPLRTDIHRFLDRSQLTLVPKPNPKTGSTTNQSYTLVSHVLRAPGKSDEGNLEMIRFYHDLKVYTLIGNPIEYLFARFAWSLFDDTIMLLFQPKDTKKTKFFVMLSDESDNSQDRKQVLREFKGNPPLPRSGTREKNYGTKHPLLDIGDNVDDVNDVESRKSFDPASYDAAFDDIHSQYSNSDICYPRKRSRSSSPGNSDYTDCDLDLDSTHSPKPTDQPASNASPSSSNDEMESLPESSPKPHISKNNGVTNCGKLGLIKNTYGFYSAKRLGFQ